MDGKTDRGEAARVIGDPRDVVLDDLARELAHLDGQLADARADRDAYRVVALAALAQLATMTRTIDAQRRRISLLCEAQRSARAIDDAEAAA